MTSDRMPKTRIWDLDPDPDTEDPSVNVYTDGSKEEGRTGAGFCICKGDTVVAEDTQYLGNLASVFQAEVHAIQMAMRHVTQNPEKFEGEILAVHTDSQAALKALTSSVARSKQVLEAIHDIVKAQDVCKVSIRWVKGHADNTGNEFADCLAKTGNGMGAEGPVPMIPVSNSCVKSAINEEFLKRWQTRWEKRTDVKHSRLMCPEVDTKRVKRMVKFTRKELQQLAQIITGHCLLGRHLSHWQEVPRECRLCDDGLESPHHLLQECRTLTLEQMNFWNRVGEGKLTGELLLSYFRDPKVKRLFYTDEDIEEDVE